MAYYVVSGIGPEGRRQTLFLEATVGDEAVRKLHERDWTDVVLHTDDVTAALQKTIPAFPASVYLRLRRRAGWQNYLTQVAFIYRKLAVPLAICLAFFFWSYQNGLLHWKLVLVFLTPFVVPALLLVFVPAAWVARRQARALRHELYGRWEDMLRLVSGLGKPIPATHRHYLRAVALASLGRVDEAVQDLDLARQTGDVPEWLYHSWLAEIYYRGKRPRHTKEHEQIALQLSPGNVSVLMACGMRRLIVDRDLHQAASFLAEARKHAIAETVSPFCDLLQGWIALERRQHDEAERLLLRAEEEAGQFRGFPAYQWPLALVRGCLALTWARQGEHAKAARAFARARPILEGRAFHVLLDPCRKELGVI